MNTPVVPLALCFYRPAVFALCLMAGWLATPALQLQAQTEAVPKVPAAVNGVPANMQRTFLTKRNNIRMKWDPSGFWFSDAAALLLGSDPNEVCQDLTAISRSTGQIPRSFSFRHVGKGKVECRSGGAVPTTKAPAPSADSKPSVSPQPSVPKKVDDSGVPLIMQKSFVTKRSSIVMRWNPAGYWSSNVGALLPGADPDETCKDLTSMCRGDNKIPKGFSFRHVGNGKLECRADK